MALQDYQGWLGLVGGIIGIAVAVATYFRGVIQQNAKIHMLELEVNTIETRFNVFWAVVEKELPKVLIRPHQPEIDAYLRKMKNGEKMTDEEKADMVRRMREVIDNPEGLDDFVLINGYVWLVARFESELTIKDHDSYVRLKQKLKAKKEEEEKEENTKKNEKRKLRFW